MVQNMKKVAHNYCSRVRFRLGDVGATFHVLWC